MTPLMEKTLEAIRGWPRNRQDAAAELLLALDRLRPSAHRASAEELAASTKRLSRLRAASVPVRPSQKQNGARQSV
jgi:hypothetical protein